MNEKTLAALRAELGQSAKQLPDLDGVDDSAIEKLTVQLRQAKRRQRELLDASAENSLRFVPALLRGTFRKFLFG